MASYKIQLLDAPPSTQTFYGDGAMGLNNSGVAVGHASIPSSTAIQWNPNPSVLPAIGQQSLAININDKNEIVGTWGNNVFPGQAFLYKNGVTNNLENVFNKEESMAHDINNNGIIAASAGKIGGLHAFVYDSVAQSAPIDLGVLPKLQHDVSIPSSINNKGHITGISKKWSGAQNSHAFFYDGKKLRDLGAAVYADDINDNGQVVGAHVLQGASNWTAFLCDASGGSAQFQDLGALPLPGFVGSEAMAINNNGDIVGHSFTQLGAGQQIRAFVYPAGGQMEDLTSLLPSNSGWLLQWASAINDKGQIAGTGVYNGENRAYLLTPVSKFDSIYEAAIDPLALILRNDIYVKLKLPNPPPDGVLHTTIERLVKGMSVKQREQALYQVKVFDRYLKQLEKELNQY
jgi:probable HAF family extracellular repeat protein